MLYLQKEDIGPVIKMLEYYSGLIKNTDPVATTYFSYITSNDIQILCRYEEKAFTNTYLTVSKLYQFLRTPAQFSSIYFNNKKDIEKLTELLKSAANQL